MTTTVVGRGLLSNFCLLGKLWFTLVILLLIARNKVVHAVSVQSKAGTYIARGEIRVIMFPSHG